MDEEIQTIKADSLKPYHAMTRSVTASPPSASWRPCSAS